jgi:uncharacterized protein YkwD
MATLACTRRKFAALLLTPLAAVAARSIPGVSAAPVAVSRGETAELISAGSYCPSSAELEFLTLINNYRKANGKGALRISNTLGAAARHHAVDMAKNNYFSHTLASGATWSANIKNHAYSASLAIAENIAAGSSSATSTFDLWRNSSGHRAIMLSSTYKAIGIGRAYSSTSKHGYYWATTFGGAFDAAPAC